MLLSSLPYIADIHAVYLQYKNAHSPSGGAVMGGEAYAYPALLTDSPTHPLVSS